MHGRKPIVNCHSFQGLDNHLLELHRWQSRLQVGSLRTPLTTRFAEGGLNAEELGSDPDLQSALPSMQLEKMIIEALGSCDN